MIATACVGQVLRLHREAGQLLEPCDCLEHGDRVGATSAEVVDRSRPGAVREGEDRPADVEGMDVVKKTEAVGSSSGKTRAPVVVAASGQL